MSKLTFQKNASYASTIQKELEKNLNLKAGEKLISQERIRFYGLIFSQMGRIALTNQRIALVKHFQFKPDVFYSIDLKDITKLELISDLEIPKARLERFLAFLNNLTTGNFKILRISFVINNRSRTLDIFCWDNRFIYRSMSWKPNKKKTEVLFERLNSFI